MKGDKLMKYVNIAVRNKIARTDEEQAQIVCGNSDYTIKFDFDEEWSAETVKTARFIFASNGKYIDVQFSGDECHMPVISDTTSVLVGVFAGNLCTTTGALIHSIPCITDPDGTPVEPTPDVYAQLMERFNAMVPPAAVLYTAQELTDEQKAQVRENIGAADKNATGGGDAPSGGGGGTSPYKTLYSQTLEEAGAVSVTMDDEAAACNDYLMYLAVPKGDAAVSFSYKTTVFGAMYAVINVRAVDASYGTLVVVSAARTPSSFMLVETKTTQTSTGTPYFSTTPRQNFGIPQIQHISAENTSVLFSSAIELPAGTQILILGR